MSRNELSLGVMYPSKYLRWEDLQGKPATVEIASVQMEPVVMEGGKKEVKVVLGLKKTQKLMIAGKTNGYALGLLLGTNASDWIGKRVTLIQDRDNLGSDVVGCIRVHGSPDAAPDRAKAYAQAWKGERMRGKLVGRIKKAIARMNPQMQAASEPDDVQEPSPPLELPAHEEMFPDQPEASDPQLTQ